MRYRIDVDSTTAQFLRHMHPVQKQTVKASLDDLARDPFIGKQLQRELTGLYSYRVGRYRIIYAINKEAKEINIVTIGPRSSVYETLEGVKTTKKQRNKN